MKYTSKKKNFFKRFLLIIFLVVLTIGGLGYAFFKSKVPQMSGELRVKGITDTVTVERDSFGIPHIYAKNKKDAFFTLGYVQASERLFQMDMARRMAKGELSEIVGEATLESDKLFKNLRIKKTAASIIQNKMSNGLYNPEMLELAQAYYEGINSFIDEGELPPEYLLLRTTPEKFSMEDSYSFIGMMGFSFGIALMNEPLLTKLSKELGEELVGDLRIETLKNETPVLTDHMQGVKESLQGKILEVVSFLENSYPLFEGSNGWLIHKSRTKNKASLFANDPHISFPHPGIWFEAHIKTPDYENYGHFLPAIPFAVLSHNEKRAWGLTMSLTDDMDLYQENIDFETLSYFFKDQTLPIKLEEDFIKIKGKEDLPLNIYRTHHGPIMNSLSDVPKEKAISLQWSYYSETNDALSTLFEMDKAKNVEEFKNAVATGVSPGLNILYADKDNIGHWIFGEIWVKKAGLKRDFILNGSSGEDEILKNLSFAEKPSSFNPKEGFIVSANSRPEYFPENIRGDWQPSDRYQTIYAILAQNQEWTAEQTQEVQTLETNFENKAMIQKLLSIVKFEQLGPNFVAVKEILGNWDLISHKDSQAAAIFYSWTRNIFLTTLADLKPEEREILTKTPNGHLFTKRIILNDESPWWKRLDKEETISAALKKTVNELASSFGPSPKDWTWGRLHTISFEHPVGKIWPLNYIFNLGPYPIGGATQEINNLKSNTIKQGFSVQAGPSTRRIIDFSHPKNSFGILPTGNSGHVLSPFYKNQLELFINRKYRPQLLELTKKDVYGTLTISPVE